jgi:hypothetical protein
MAFQLTEIAFICEKPDSETMHVTHSISGTTATCHSRESNENISLLSGGIQEGSTSDVGPVAV